MDPNFPLFCLWRFDLIDKRSMKTKRIVVTGAAGLIGNAVVEHLSAQGFNIVATTREDGDLQDRSLMDKWMSEVPGLLVPCAAAIPLAAEGTTSELERSIGKSTTISDFCARSETRLILCPARSVYQAKSGPSFGKSAANFIDVLCGPEDGFRKPNLR
jgi:nucleoside-diphosphate-sugar epimerase